MNEETNPAKYLPEIKSTHLNDEIVEINLNQSMENIWFYLI